LIEKNVELNPKIRMAVHLRMKEKKMLEKLGQYFFANAKQILEKLKDEL
jgi:hypothetical protein